MHPKTLLRLEGFLVFLGTTIIYFSRSESILLYLVVAVAPDISMAGYLHDPEFGSIVYNAFHTYASPVLLIGVGTYAAIPVLVDIGLVWSAHIGIDRSLQYGLKYGEAFEENVFQRL